MPKGLLLGNFLKHGFRKFSYIYLIVAIVITPLLMYTLFQAKWARYSSSLLHQLEFNNFDSTPFSERPEASDSNPFFNKNGLHFISENRSKHLPGRSSSNLSQTSESEQRGCIIPRLKVKDPDIIQFYKELKPVSCSGFDWVSLRNGKFTITPEAKKKYGNGVKCSLTELYMKTDFLTNEKQPPTVGVKDGSDITHDFYKVDCQAGAEKYRNYHAGIHRDSEVLKRKRPRPPPGASRDRNNSLDLDVIIIGQDSMSHMAWIRHLPLTRKYLVDNLKATEMEGHTILGDGTPATMFPLLTGKREEELPEARRGYSGAKTVDDFPWVWKDFRHAGYVTSWQEDQPHIGTFHYRLLGFEKQPVDHYYRPFAVYAGNHAEESETNCLGSKPVIVAQNDYITDVFDVYQGQGQRKWAMSFKSDNSHENNNHASRIDVHMRNHLKELHEKGHLDNAILIMFADHGARFSKIRAFAQGKQEERMPYLAIRLPDKFHAKYPDIIANIKHNSQRLTTPFDIHETLHEILHYTGSGPADISKRGVSLFKKIPAERDCKSADIDAHWCFCLDWSPVDVKSDVIKQALSHVLDTINGVTEKHREECPVLTPKEIKSAMAIKVKDDVLKFKDTNDGGRGRFGKMNDVTKHSKIVYQITFVTTPGGGLFEVTVTQDLKTNAFSTNMESISRINKYGNSPWCVMESFPHLRKYCACRQPPPASFKEHH